MLCHSSSPFLRSPASCVWVKVIRRRRSTISYHIFQKCEQNMKIQSVKFLQFRCKTERLSNQSQISGFFLDGNKCLPCIAAQPPPLAVMFSAAVQSNPPHPRHISPLKHLSMHSPDLFHIRPRRFRSNMQRTAVSNAACCYGAGPVRSCLNAECLFSPLTDFSTKARAPKSLAQSFTLLPLWYWERIFTATLILVRGFDNPCIAVRTCTMADTHVGTG